MGLLFGDWRSPLGLHPSAGMVYLSMGETCVQCQMFAIGPVPEGEVKYIQLSEFVFAGVSCLGCLGGHMGVSTPCRSYPSAYAVTILSVFYPSYIQNLERPPRGRNRRIVRDIPTPRTKLSRKPGGRTRRRTRRYSRTRWGFYETIRNNYIELFGRILFVGNETIHGEARARHLRTTTKILTSSGAC